MTFKKIVCMGDSITEGFGVDQKESYPAVLAKILGSGFTVVNKGLCSTTTINTENENGIMGYPYLLQDRYREALQEKGDIYVILLGTNDAQDGMDDTEDFIHEENNMISKKELFVPCYRQILTDIRKVNPKAEIYAGLPVPVQVCIWRKHQESYLKQIRACIREALADTDVKIIDLNGIFAVLPAAEQQKLYQADGLHPNAAGLALIAETVAKAILTY